MARKRWYESYPVLDPRADYIGGWYWNPDRRWLEYWTITLRPGGVRYILTETDLRGMRRRMLRKITKEIQQQSLMEGL